MGPDSDDDGLVEGLAAGVSRRRASPDSDGYVPDDDPRSTTDPLLADTDGGGFMDGTEDANANGRVDDAESDPNDPRDDIVCQSVTDCDLDGLDNDTEEWWGTNPFDADSDDGGRPDGAEYNLHTDGLDPSDDGYVPPLPPEEGCESCSAVGGSGGLIPVLGVLLGIAAVRRRRG